MRNFVSTLIVLLIGLLVIWEGTDGLHAFTTEKARRIKITETAPMLPNVKLEDSEGQELQLHDYKGKIVLATFMYTSCGDACPILEMKFKEVYDGLPKQSLGKDVVFLSFSFDQKRDTPERLKEYGKHLEVDNITWKMVRFTNQAAQQSFLDLIGVIVIPNETGGYEHNSAIYMINEKGQLVEIFDYQDPEKVINKVTSIIKAT